MSNQNARALRLTALWLVGINFLTVLLHSVAHFQTLCSSNRFLERTAGSSGA